MQILTHRLNRNVTVALGRVLFRQPVHPLDHSIGLGSVRQRRPMFDRLLLTELPKVMHRLDGRAPAVLEAFQGELAPVVRQDLADLEWKERQALLQKVGGRLLVLVLIDPKERQTSGTVNGDEAVALLAFEFGQIEAVDVNEAGAVVLELTVFVVLACLLLLFFGRRLTPFLLNRR